MSVLSGLLLGMLLSGLDQTIVSTAARTVGDDLGGLDQIAWVTTSFLVTSTITTLIYGKLSDVFGRKPLYMTAISIFLIGSALCGLATSVPLLAAFRALQGLGAGGLMSLAFAITGTIIPPRERSKYQGYFAGTMAFSSVLGPLVGGFFADTASIGPIAGWRFAFWVNIPIGLAALVIVARTLKIERSSIRRRMDFVGAGFLVVATVPLLLAGEEGSHWGWTSTASVLCCTVGGIATAVFLLWQHRMGPDALLPLRLFRTRKFTVPVLITFVTGAVQIGALAVLPLYLQIVRGASPTQSGLLLIPMVLGISATSIVIGRIVRRTGRTKVFPVFGAAVQVVAFLGLSTVTPDTSLVFVDVLMFLVGVGLGATANTIILILQNSVEISDLGVATASSTFFRNVGATAGTALLISILFATATSAITAAYDHARSSASFVAAIAAHPEQGQVLASGIRGGLADTSFLSKLDPALAAPFLNGFAHAMDLAALIAAGLAVIGLILSLLIKEVPLRATSARVAAQAPAATATGPTTSEH
ncbi:MDR family MFS transporter [Curtobacterium sp. ISL-83]|uniref:MDR family MFS transporter n=1 Tax=Curtobacterium sp. ISL-83 TaxID=2819145 RepID=UPI001BE7C06D|nr:MDR family MFS transporter [Curtobacterium sp. ISL-83]MBT2504282.1 MFS transporter [Curtobacterium sp. ISL-83]